MSHLENNGAAVRDSSLPHASAFRVAPRSFIATLVLAALVGAGTFWWQVGRWQWISDESLLAWTESHPRESAAQIALGRRLRQRGQKAPAAFAFERALQAQPEDIGTRRELLRTLLALQQNDAALLQMREIVRRDPTDAFCQERLGEFYLSHGALSWAVQAFEHVVAAQPRNAAAWSRLAETYLSLNQSRRSAEAFEKASSLAPARPEYRIGLARARLEAGRTDLAEQLLHSETDGPAGGRAAYELGILYMRSTGDPIAQQQARVWLERAGSLDPAAPGPLLALGKLLLRTRQTDQAVAPLERAASLMADNTEPLYYLSRAYREVGRDQEACDCLARFSELRRAQDERQNRELRLIQSPGDQTTRAQLADPNAGSGDETLHHPPKADDRQAVAEDARQP